MIPRYSLPEMAGIWSDSHKLEVWKEVEALALEAWVGLGVAPEEAATSLRGVPVPTPEQVEERERVTDHDLAAFVDLLGSAMEEGGEWVHYGLTSSDVLDTAAGVIMSKAGAILMEKTIALFDIVKARALEHRSTVMVGRTHGIWAEPTSFGLKLAGWAFELARAHQRLSTATATVSVGKISGAVGTYAHTPSAVEAHVCARLGLQPEPASTQVTARDRHAEFLSAIALVGASLERMATEIRHLQRSEVGRGEGAISDRAERFLCHAPQAQPDRLGTDHRDGPAAAGLRPGGSRKRRALARTRHQPLVRGASDPARRLPRPRLHAARSSPPSSRDWWSTPTGCWPTSKRPGDWYTARRSCWL